MKGVAFSPLLRLKKDQKFVWGDEQQKAFNEIKEYMKEPPVLVPPQLNKPFELYVAADTHEDHVWFEDWWMVASLCDE
jgi:DNA topoisomerase IB